MIHTERTLHIRSRMISCKDLVSIILVLVNRNRNDLFNSTSIISSSHYGKYSNRM